MTRENAKQRNYTKNDKNRRVSNNNKWWWTTIDRNALDNFESCQRFFCDFLRVGLPFKFVYWNWEPFKVPTPPSEDCLSNIAFVIDLVVLLFSSTPTSLFLTVGRGLLPFVIALATVPRQSREDLIKRQLKWVMQIIMALVFTLLSSQVFRLSHVLYVFFFVFFQ